MRLAQVCGAPGVGKSTLLEALGDRALHGTPLRMLAKSRQPVIDTGWLEALNGTPQWREIAEVSLRRAAAVRALAGDGLAVDDHMPLLRAIGAPAGYCDAMPLPDVAVFCVAPIVVIEGRIAERIRQGRKPGRVYDTPAAVDDVHRAIDAMLDREAQVLVLNMTDPVEINAAKVLAC